MKKLLGLFGFICVLVLGVDAQPVLSIKAISEYKEFGQRFSLAKPFIEPSEGEANAYQAPANFLPKFALDNPSGYSFLCNLELKAENKLPVGIWVQLGDDEGLSVRPIRPVNLSYVQLKLLRF